MLRGHIQFARKFREVWAELLRFSDLRNYGAKMGAHIETSLHPEHYYDPTQEVNKIITNEVNAKPRPKIREALLSLRDRLNFTQRQMAEILGVSQAQIAKWENERAVPPGQFFAKLSEYVPEDEKSWWLEMAGFRVQPEPVEQRTRLIPLLRDPAAAGTPRALEARETSDYLSLPRQWMPEGGTLQAVEVKGHSMEPILCEGFIVIVDVDQRAAARLIDHMVLARVGGGVTVTWLRKSGTTLMLVPQNMNTDNPVQLIQAGMDIQLIGTVVKWIGQPTTPKKRK